MKNVSPSNNGISDLRQENSKLNRASGNTSSRSLKWDHVCHKRPHSACETISPPAKTSPRDNYNRSMDKNRSIDNGLSGVPDVDNVDSVSGNRTSTHSTVVDSCTTVIRGDSPGQHVVDVITLPTADTSRLNASNNSSNLELSGSSENLDIITVGVYLFHLMDYLWGQNQGHTSDTNTVYPTLINNRDDLSFLSLCNIN